MKTQINKLHRRKTSQLFLFIFLFVIAVCPSFGQTVNKKKITQDDYALWSTLYAPIISNDGQWAAWKLNYKGITDSLIVINTQTRKTMKYNNTREHEFSPNSKWIYNFEPNRIIHLINLESGETTTYPDLELFYFSEKGDYAGILDKNKTFFLVDFNTAKSSQFHNVTWFAFSPDGKYAAISTATEGKNTIELLDTETLKRFVLLSSEESSFSNMVWNTQSTGLAFMEEFKDADGKTSSTTLYEFRNGDKPKLRSLNPTWQKDFPNNSYVSANNELFYAADGERIFFNIRPKSYLERNLDSIKNNVQVWRGDDKWIVPRQLKNANPAFGPWLTQWSPNKKEVLQIANESLPIAYLLPQDHKAILFDPMQYEPQYKGTVDADIYLMDLKTSEKKLILKKQVHDYHNKYGSPNGEAIAYYRDKKWWVYDVNKNKHIDVSTNIPFSMFTTDHHSSNAIWGYGFAGWSPDSKWIYIYDEFDIWKVAANGREFHRITNGREKNMAYRVYNQQFEEFPFQRFGRFTLTVFDSGKGEILKATSPNGSGYYTYNDTNGIQSLFIKNTKIEKLKRAKEEGSYIVQEESYNIPKRIYLLEDGKETLLYESNPQFKEFASPRQELINYSGPEGEDLQGILMYPVDYVAGKQYPMLVHIYEKFSDKFHNYLTPSLYNGDGFNPAIYTGQGYFVLYPDIVYKLGDPGVSALQCVTTAVKTVLKSGMVDENRMGLQGQSYGGYEAAFIATQTDMFAAVVSSSGVTNFLSFYLTIGGYTGEENMWWLEDHQWRMGRSYFDDTEGYKRNSPMEYVKNVNTPILLWSGADDVHIDVTQNIQFYLALRRLNKEVTFLYYPQESHGLLKPKNQIDLTNRISAWLKSYLKP